MTVILTDDLFSKLCPKAPKSINTAFVAKQNVIAEILATPERLALAIANIYAETNGYALAGLTEDIHYSAERMAAVWPNRFNRGKDARGKYIPDASKVRARYGTAAGWQNIAFNDIYGNRMGNRPNSNDGSTFIGRGGPQVTGRDGYGAVGNIIGVNLVANPSLASSPNLQPDILAAFWKWKNISRFADNGDIVGARKVWNGGTNGLDDVQAQYPRLLKIIKAYVPTTAAVVVKASNVTFDAILLEVQQELIELGYHEIGEADGLIGAKTRGAIVAFSVDRSSPGLMYPANGNYIGSPLHAEMNKAVQEDWHRPVAPSRAFATTEQLAPKVASVAPTQSAGFFAKIGAWFGGATATVKLGIATMPDVNNDAYPYISIIQQFWSDIPGWVFPAVIAGIAIAIAYKTTQANKATTDAYQQGKIN